MIAAVSTPYTVPAGLMDALQVTVLVLVAVVPPPWCSSGRTSARCSR